MDQYQLDMVKRKRDQLVLELAVLDAQLKLRDNIAAELEEIEDFLEEVIVSGSD